MLICCSFFKVYSQQLSNTVISAGGNYSSASWGSISATMGEAVITTISASNFTLTQGFQQPQQGGVGIPSVKNSTPLIALYPNPANSELFLELTMPYASAINYKIFDMNGKELLSGNFTADAMHTTLKKINAENLSSGMYLVSVNAGSENIRNIKIQVSH
jgi:hypothetical protein